nr:hypothetical protein [Tanacetum cinerariifolium]
GIVAEKFSDMFSQFVSGGASGSGGCGDEEEGADHQDDEDEDGDGDAYDMSPGKMCHRRTLFLTGKYVGPTFSPRNVARKYSDMFSQFDSGGANGSGGCVDEEGADHQDNKDEDGDGDA